jgi:hypothetical protein
MAGVPDEQRGSQVPGSGVRVRVHFVGEGVGVSGRLEFEYLLGLGSMESLLEERLHRLQADVAPPDEPFVIGLDREHRYQQDQ